MLFPGDDVLGELYEEDGAGGVAVGGLGVGGDLGGLAWISGGGAAMVGTKSRAARTASTDPATKALQLSWASSLGVEMKRETTGSLSMIMSAGRTRGGGGVHSSGLSLLRSSESAGRPKTAR